MTVEVKDGTRLSGLTTQELLGEELNSRKLQLFNLFMPDRNHWQCNLRTIPPNVDHNPYYEYGEGVTHREAIFVALHNITYTANKHRSQGWYVAQVQRGYSEEEKVWFPETCKFDKHVKAIYKKGWRPTTFAPVMNSFDKLIADSKYIVILHPLNSWNSSKRVLRQGSPTEVLGYAQRSI